MIARYYGHKIPLKHLRSISDLNRLGMSIKDITDCCASEGMLAKAVRIDLETASRMPLPAILYWRQRHFVVLYRVDDKRGKYYIADPAQGKSVYSREDFNKYWIPEGGDRGLAVLVEPDDTFDDHVYERTNNLRQMFRYMGCFIRQRSKSFIVILLLSLLIMLADMAMPLLLRETIDKGIGLKDMGLVVTSLAIIVPLAFATIMEHVGDVCAISSTVGKNYIVEPGLNRTLMGDGLATTLASLFGAPANTTYGENTGVLALSKVYDPRVIRLAALFAIILSFCPKFAALVTAMPTATIGGVSMILYGMISAVGVRNVVENRVDFTNTRNVIIAALILVLALGISNSTAGAVHIGSVSLSGLAVASIVGIALNAILPGKDYVFEQEDEGSTSVDLSGAINMEENK